MNKGFTKKQINNIISLYTKDKLSTTKIGKKYNVTCNTIIKILRNSGIYVSSGLLQTVLFTEKDKKDIINRHKNRENNLQIARIYKCSYATIRKLLIESGVYCKNRVHNKIIFSVKDYRRIIQIYNSGESANSISKQFGVSDSVILALLHENNIDTSDRSRGDKSKYFLDRGHIKTCRSLSRRMYNDHVSKINPKRNPISRYEYHLDHKMSIAVGYSLGLTVLDLAHPCNLRVIRAFTNLSKGIKFCIEKQELLNRIKIWNKKYGDPFQGIKMEIIYDYSYGRYKYIKGSYRYYGAYKV